jgi:Domain of unknown function (DUF4340)
MKRAWIVNLLLLAGVVGLAVYAWHQGNQPKEPSHKLSVLSAASIKKIEVTPRDGAGYTLEKRGETWFLTSPLDARADQTQVQRILDLLSASSKEKLAATDLKRFDLDPPALKVAFDGQAFSFGTMNPLTQDQYLATGDGVYLVSTYYLSLVPTRADRLLSHSLFNQDEKPVSFAFKNFRVEQKEGKWTVSPEAAEKERPSQDDLNRWADDWRLASSLLTQPWSGKPTPETVQVKLADGKRVVFMVVRKEPELILARPDEKLQFQFSGEMSRRLLQPTPAKAKEGAGAS